MSSAHYFAHYTRDMLKISPGSWNASAKACLSTRSQPRVVGLPEHMYGFRGPPGSCVASAKVCPSTRSEPRLSTSVLKKPASEPLPY